MDSETHIPILSIRMQGIAMVVVFPRELYIIHQVAFGDGVGDGICQGNSAQYTSDGEGSNV